jgi:hypothetical protein
MFGTSISEATMRPNPIGEEGLTAAKAAAGSLPADPAITDLFNAPGAISHGPYIHSGAA